MFDLSSILERLKAKVKQSPRLKSLILGFRHPLVYMFGYLYGAYLTVRFVDQYKSFPAILFKNGLIRLHIRKGFDSRLIIGERLVVQPLGVSRMPSLIQIGSGGTVEIKNEFIIGDDVRISTSDSGEIIIGGRDKQSASGITARSIVKAHRKLTIGYDTIIAWDTFITDSDWHPIEGLPTHGDTVIGNHVWISVGAKVLKGSVVGENSIVGCGAVVAGGAFSDRSLLVGIPAKAVKTNIPNWSRDMTSDD